MSGSSALSAEQADWFVEKHGERYVRVQSGDPYRPSRKLRRASGERSQRAMGRLSRSVKERR